MYSSVTQGEMIGYSLTEGKTGTTADFAESDVWFEDPNADVLAAVVQKGLIFEDVQNPYSVIPSPYNPAGLYYDLWAASPNNAIVTDYTYALILLLKNSTLRLTPLILRDPSVEPTKASTKKSTK